MGKVSESIWSNNEVIIPMAEVSHIIKLNNSHIDFKDPIRVIYKHSKFNNETQDFEPNTYLDNEAASQFRSDWCFYRHELEIETLKDPHEDLELCAKNMNGFFNDIQKICKEYKACRSISDQVADTKEGS